MICSPWLSLGRTSWPPAPQCRPGPRPQRGLLQQDVRRLPGWRRRRQLVDVVWLPRKWGKSVKATRINGVAAQLAAVSAELDALPSTFDQFLFPSAGTYVCRPFAGTSAGQRARPWHCHRHRHQARPLLALGRAQSRRRDSLSQPNTLRDRRDLRGTASSGAASGITTIPCTSSSAPNSSATRADPDPWSKSSTDDRHHLGPRNSGAANAVVGRFDGTNRPISAPQYLRLPSGALPP